MDQAKHIQKKRMGDINYKLYCTMEPFGYKRVGELLSSLIYVHGSDLRNDHVTGERGLLGMLILKLNSTSKQENRYTCLFNPSIHYLYYFKI